MMNEGLLEYCDAELNIRAIGFVSFRVCNQSK